MRIRNLIQPNNNLRFFLSTKRSKAGRGEACYAIGQRNLHLTANSISFGIHTIAC
ncbi:hypothetical protein Q067_02330 [Pseudomonas aeruginosa BL13]|nr:hypothetical protein Q067_02330 [Pseudomonas aeruginosa BL13]